MNSRTPHRWRWFVLGLVSGPILAAAIFVGTARWWFPVLGTSLAMTPCEGQTDVIVVLGGGGPERAVHGIQLYRQGVAPKLWFTGDRPVPEMPSFTDGQLARDLAVREGVPAGDIYLLKTTSTWEDGQQIAAGVKQQGLRRIVIVTNWYHSRRALAVIRKQLAGESVEVFYSPPPTSVRCPDRCWSRDEWMIMIVNEWIKIGVYWVKYGLSPWAMSL
ncbi:MAG: YdcF family protein [Verrucomicrobia bacterium]|nr:YdcF family protein [Verrucomicrobiota bacterium]MBU4292396.1 YdcF family protein [Verrucomicrobiota bacterium]MBU4429784.1 YdcF family protein [Verrucomicrobiota bacterium]MBU4497339.1 YdcF family protein [Verrucomicrobiota bacterium]MCG2679819.1 YdcF family protein [Kiritimatiellia bacterium]